MLAMGGAPILGFDIQAHNLAKHRASLHPTDGRAALEVQAATSSPGNDQLQQPPPIGDSPAEAPKQTRPLIPAAQVWSLC